MITKIRSSYFRLLDIVVNYTGCSKKILHEYWINKIFPFLLEDPDNFIKEKEVINSTTILTEKGWNNFYNEFRHFCLDVLKIG